MGKSFRYDPDEDYDVQMSSKQRKKLRKAVKETRRARERKFEELEESADSTM